MAVVVFLFLSVCVTLTSGADPQGCTYDTASKEYSCTARSWSLPLTYSDFDNVPQVLKLVEVNGALPPGGTLSGFDTINTGLFDGNVVPSLHVRCVTGGSLIIMNGTFSNMGYVKELRFFDCHILAVPDDVFYSFGTLNVFSVDGGSISTIGFNAFNGVNIERMDSVPEPLGLLAFRNTQFTSGGLPNGALYALANVSIILLENSHVRVMQKDMFQANTKVTYISLKDNPVLYLPEDMFIKSTSLTTLELAGIPWDCTCSNMWIYEYIVKYNITLKGDIVCATPTSFTNKKGSQYLKDECDHTTACGDNLGIVIGDYCYLIMDIVFHGVLLVTFIIGLVAFALTIHLKRQTGGAQAGGPKKPGEGGRRKRPPGKRRPKKMDSIV